MMKLKKIIAAITKTIFFVAVLLAAGTVTAQNVSIKNNLLYDATLTPNLGIELKTGSQSSVQLFYGLNPWNGYHGDKKLKHWSLMPEYRYWLSEPVFKGTFVGIHALGGEYNVGGVKLPFGLFPALKDNHYEGWYAGAGLTIGHAWPFCSYWRLEAALGIGYIHTKYDKYELGECGRPLDCGHYNYFGPTKLALNLAYTFPSGKPAPAPVVEQPPVLPEPVAEPQYNLTYIVPQAEAEKARALSGKAFLDFRVNKTDIDQTYRNNPLELAKVQQTIDAVRNDQNTTITAISIHGYASPEGNYQNNARLAQGRAQAFTDYVRSLIDLPASVFTVESTPEDWDGLIATLSQKGTTADALLDIVRSTELTPDQKEQQLRQKHPAEWKQMLSDIFPALRHSDYVVQYTVRPFSVSEAREILKVKPQQLSLNEMFLVAQTYEPGSAEFNEVFEVAVRMFPNDPTANLNAAVTALNRGDLTAAARYLEKAGNSPEAQEARKALEGKLKN